MVSLFLKAPVLTKDNSRFFKSSIPVFCLAESNKTVDSCWLMLDSYSGESRSDLFMIVINGFNGI